jgi:hypothetical protein
VATFGPWFHLMAPLIRTFSGYDGRPFLGDANHRIITDENLSPFRSGMLSRRTVGGNRSTPNQVEYFIIFEKIKELSSLNIHGRSYQHEGGLASNGKFSVHGTNCANNSTEQWRDQTTAAANI